MEIRLDRFLVTKGYVPSREKAKELIRSGQVYIEGRQALKASMPVREDFDGHVEVGGDLLTFVSRAGLKLLAAVREFGLDLEGKTCMDVGASTGGFTDCMLREGAARVYAVDVGTGQLHESLRRDPGVISMEQTNIRFLKPEDIGEMMDFISIDVSFISLKIVLPAARSFLGRGGEMVCLVKPQFEAGRASLNKKGLVKDQRIREKVLADIKAYALSIGLRPAGLIPSPIQGQEGNVEYLLWLVTSGT